MGTHFVCTGGCQGVADEPGVCQAENCKKYHNDLQPCSCENGNHDSIISAEKSTEETA